MSEEELFELWCQEGKNPYLFPFVVEPTREEMEMTRNGTD